MRRYSSFLSRDGFAIFLFHGVIRERRHLVRNYTEKHILLDRFVSVLRELCSSGVAVSMNDVVEATVENKPLPDQAFVITFDDGFENNCSVAAPALSDLGVPATFYVTTGFIESNSGSWIDMIEYAVERVGAAHLTLPAPMPSGAFETREEKIGLLDHIRRAVKGDAQIDPYEFAWDVCRQLGVKEIEPDADLDQKMSWEQARSLSRDPLFSIGGHGHTHRILEFLDHRELEREIAESLNSLKANLDCEIEHYSYPEGLSNCYSDRVIYLLKERGIVCAPSAEHGINRVGDDLLHLKRIMVI